MTCGDPWGGLVTVISDNDKNENVHKSLSSGEKMPMVASSPPFGVINCSLVHLLGNYCVPDPTDSVPLSF